MAPKYIRYTSRRVEAMLLVEMGITVGQTDFNLVWFLTFIASTVLVRMKTRHQEIKNFKIQHLHHSTPEIVIFKATVICFNWLLLLHFIMNSTYSFRIFGLSKYFQKIIIGEKVEAWEDLPLCLQIHIKRFLDLFQFQIHVIQCVKQAWKWKIAKLSPLQELLKALPLKVLYLWNTKSWSDL